MSKHSKKNSKSDINAFRLLREQPYCYICGKPANHAHHIAQRSVYPELIDDPLNLIPLCADCHQKIHADSKLLHLLYAILIVRHRILGIDLPKELERRLLYKLKSD